MLFLKEENMAIPSYKQMMPVILESLSQNGSLWTRKKIYEQIERTFNLSLDDQKITVNSGMEPLYQNRASWALTYLKNAGLIESPNRAQFKATPEGKQLSQTNPQSGDKRFFIRAKTTAIENSDTFSSKPDDISPTERMNHTYQEIKCTVCDDLLNRILSQSPVFFEQLVVQLIKAMGYGGDFDGSALVTGQSGDEGIDGIIAEDKLGLDVIFLQAKRWGKDRPVGRPEIQKFVGALAGQGAKKGIFITTSYFTNEAISYQATSDMKIIRIDGTRLTSLMYEYNVGVSSEATYVIKRIDSDFFELP